MDDLYTKWKVMWDAKEFGTQSFFLFMAFIGVMITIKPLRASTEGTATRKGMTFAFGLCYLAIVITGYLQLAPKISSY